MCPWALWTEQIDVGWVVVSMSTRAVSEYDAQGYHNHELYRGTVASNTNARNRSIPPHLHNHASILVDAGLTIAKVYAALVKRCVANGEEVTFTKKDLENEFCVREEDKVLDATNLVTHLQERMISNSSLYFKVHTDEDGTLDRVFFVMEGAVELWLHSAKKVILLDTKHGTNRFGMKLGCLTTSDKNGKTRVLSATFLLHEDSPSFNWLLEQFSTAFGGEPAVVFTDGDHAMADSIATLWKESRHLLCTFHLWKNFYTHLHPLFHNNEKGWKQLANLWWRLCKDNEEATRLTFNSRFDEMRDFLLKEATVTPEKVNEQLPWLEKLRSRGEQWAACYTWQYTTFGIHSTQRAEAIFSSVSTFCRKTARIWEIAKNLEQMANTQAMNSEHGALRVLLNTKISAASSLLPPAVETVCSNITEFARNIVTAQASQVPLFHVKRCDDDVDANATNENDVFGQVFLVWFANSGLSEKQNDSVLSVAGSDIPALIRNIDFGDSQPSFQNSHKTTLQSCSCQFPNCWGLPCRHMFSVAHHLCWTKV